MKNSNGKIELETAKLERVPIESNHKEINRSICQIITKIIFLLCIFFFSYNISGNIEKFDKINPQFINGKTEANLSSIEREYLYDINFYMSYRMYASKDNKGNGISYNIMFNTHTLEKGLSHFDLRPFGEIKIEGIIDLLKMQLNYKNYERFFSFINGINSLREYKKVYEEHNWTYKQEYKNVSEFLNDYENIKQQKTGAYILTKDELKNDYNIDYSKFIKSRHSTRNYKNMPLKIEDIKRAIDMAKYSPSACNRQYVKVHYYPKGKMRQNVIDYSIGKGGLYLEGVNTFIITFDTNGLIGDGERNQGYFNAGLFATNFVNALHSLGIGTCFIQFSNSVEDEEKLKNLNKIPYNERIAVILYAGYYDEKSIFCVSPRKDVEEYFTLHE
jgi:nitroreductase